MSIAFPKYDMRIGEILNEKFFIIDVPTGSCQIHEDPSVRNLLTLFAHCRWGIMRGLVVGQHVFWWDAALATHSQIAPYVGIDDLLGHNDAEGEAQRDPRSLVLAKERDGRAFLSVDPKMLSNPRIERLCQHEQIVTDQPGDSTL